MKLIPETQLSTALLTSIPVKVCNWLLLLEEDLMAPLHVGRLTVNYSPAGGNMELGSSTDKDHLLIHWDGNALITDLDPQPASTIKVSVTGTLASTICRCDEFLDIFVEVEKEIYDQIDKLQYEKLPKQCVSG